MLNLWTRRETRWIRLRSRWGGRSGHAEGLSGGEVGVRKDRCALILILSNHYHYKTARGASWPQEIFGSDVKFVAV
jgi:hypothetical protein